MSYLAIRIYGTESGEASVRLTKEFSSDSALYRADVLQLAIAELQAIYEKACTEAFAGEQESDREKRP